MPIEYPFHANKLIELAWTSNANAINVYISSKGYKVAIGSKGEKDEFILGNACSTVFKFPTKKSGLEEMARQELEYFEEDTAEKFNVFINGKLYKEGK